MRYALLATIMLVAAASTAYAQTQNLQSFAYQSTGYALVKGAPLPTFGDGAQYKAGPGFAAPDTSVFPEDDFYIRALTLTYFCATAFRLALAVVGSAFRVGLSRPLQLHDRVWLVIPCCPGRAVCHNQLPRRCGPDLPSQRRRIF